MNPLTLMIAVASLLKWYLSLLFDSQTEWKECHKKHVDRCIGALPALFNGETKQLSLCCLGVVP